MAWKVNANVPMSCLVWGGYRNIGNNLSCHNFGHLCTLCGVCSVVMFCFVFFLKFRLPIGLHSSCCISPRTSWTCQKCFSKHRFMTDRMPHIVCHHILNELLLSVAGAVLCDDACLLQGRGGRARRVRLWGLAHVLGDAQVEGRHRQEVRAPRRQEDPSHLDR